MSTITIPLATFDAMRETLEDLAAIFRLDQDTVKTSYGVCNSDRDAIHAAITAANAVSAEECTCQAKEMPFGRCCKAVQSEAIPAGMKLVPIEPTEDMISAGKRPQHGNGNPHDKAKRVYRAMLAAAPGGAA